MPPTKDRSAPTRERILDAALDLFVDQGVRGTTISDVERAVGLAAGTGSFYRHFPSKEALLRAAVDREAGRCMAEVAAERAAMVEPEDPEARFIAAADQLLADIQRFDRLFLLLLAEGDRVPELRQTIIDALGSAQALGPWMDDPTVVVLVAALSGYHLFGLVQGGPFAGVDRDDFIRTLARILLPA